ncbi:DnaJ domain-containing protein [Geopyxis carbonaria]|nr:DnaJ domain-containing protein [Geopyxis carbonaria]
MSALLSFIGWSFLPSMVTGWVLTIWYRVITRAGDQVPQRGSSRYSRDYKFVHILVVCAYLLYTIYEAYYSLQRITNFYELLSVPISVNEKALRSRFRRLTVVFHPDKAGSDGADYFVVLKQAYDVLSESTKRVAYDRFGPEIMDWKNSATLYDYMVHGGTQLLPWYAGGFLFLTILTALGKFEYGRYWRFFTFFALLIVEITVITRPYTLFTWLPLPKTLLPFEQLILARKVVLTSFIAFSQLGPMLRTDHSRIADSPDVLQNKLEIIFQAAGFTDNEANKALVQEYMPFDQDKNTLKYVETKMGEWMLEQAVRNDPEVRDAIGKAIARKRFDVPL